MFQFLIEYCASREREQNLLLESSELMRIRDDYKKKIEEIEHDHYEALAPVIGRMQVSHSLFVLRIEHIYVRMIICVQFGVDFWAYFLILSMSPHSPLQYSGRWQKVKRGQSPDGTVNGPNMGTSTDLPNPPQKVEHTICIFFF